MLPTCLRLSGRLLAAIVVSLALGNLASAAEAAPRKAKPRPAAKSEQSRQRGESLESIFSRLGLGKGSAVADIGAGGGQDTWVFARLVGDSGKVFSEEITEDKIDSLKKEAEKRGLTQVHPVLGRGDDPSLPDASCDLAYMHYVFHHFSKPRQMLRGLWRSLKPGGYLTIVDKELGTLREWVPDSIRAEQHHWTAETTVVRLAREEGFAFVRCAEDDWHGKDDFALVFQRPKGMQEPGRDPDPLLRLSVEKSLPLFLPLGRPYQRPVFVALGQSRNLIPPILKASSGPGLEIVLEEWATRKDERPPLPPQAALPSVLTDQGDPHLGPEPVDVVFFLDSYHLLFHGETLLTKLREKLSPTGCVYVLDREAKQPLSRCEASHQRKIAGETVIEEMAKAGFSLRFSGPKPAADRFLLVFGKTPAVTMSSKEDPFIGGPEVSGSPGDWLNENLWRLRGLKTVDGRVAPLKAGDREGAVEAVATLAPGKEGWLLPKSKTVLSFEKKGEIYVLSNFRSSDR